MKRDLRIQEMNKTVKKALGITIAFKINVLKCIFLNILQFLFGDLRRP